jgi:tRNA(fMet)-specific endonuclease VapC
LKYLLDTNVCIAILSGKSPLIESRLLKELTADGELYISAIAAFELWYGVAKSSRQSDNARQLVAFFGGSVSLLSFDEEDARSAGKIRADLETIGRPVGDYDLLIAGQALRHGMTLVTANVKEFARIRGLRWENWAKP